MINTCAKNQGNRFVSCISGVMYLTTRDPNDPILDAGPACGTMGAKIMKYHVLSWFIRKILAED